MFCSMMLPSANLTVTQWLNRPTMSSLVSTESIGGLVWLKDQASAPFFYFINFTCHIQDMWCWLQHHNGNTWDWSPGTAAWGSPPSASMSSSLVSCSLRSVKARSMKFLFISYSLWSDELELIISLYFKVPNSAPVTSENFSVVSKSKYCSCLMRY